MSSLLIRRLTEHARERGEAVAYTGGDPEAPVLSWSQLVGAAAALAERIREQVEPGGTVVVCLPNQPAYAVAFFGTLMADRHVFPVPCDIAVAELAEAMDESGAAGLIAPGRVAEQLEARLALRIAPDAIPDTGSAEQVERMAAACGGEGALLLQSSGSTGKPKIVRRSAPALDAVGENCRRVLSMGPGDRMLAAIPASHSYGIDHAMLGAPLAAAAVELHEWFDPEAVARRLSDGPVTLMPAVPSIYEALAASEDGGGAARRCPSLRHAYSAGGMLPESVSSAFYERFGVRIGQIYGSTEFASVTFNDPGEAPFDPSAVGRPMPGVDVRILDVDAPNVERPLEAGAVGQVAVRAPSMSDGYVNDPTPPTREGYFLSGDLGCLDAHGRLHIRGRLKLLIDVGGRKVDPLEIEALLAEHPDVSEAVVVPVEASPTVNRLKAIVTPAGDRAPSPQALRSFARGRLSRHKVPRIFEVRTELPRTALGKIRRDAVEPSSS